MDKENTQNELAGSEETKGGILRRQVGSRARDDLSSAGIVVARQFCVSGFYIADGGLPAIVPRAECLVGHRSSF